MIAREDTMRHTILAITAFAFMLTTVGCSGGGGPVADMESMAKEICDCKDKECAEKVGEKYPDDKYSDADIEKLSDEDKARIEAAAMKMFGCMLGMEAG